MNRNVYMIRLSLLFLTLILVACAPNLSSTDAAPAPPLESNPNAEAPPDEPIATELTPGNFNDAPALPIPKLQKTLQTPHIDQPPDGVIFTLTAPADINCGYQLAYQDLPELSAQFDQAVKESIPNSRAHATAFGENCMGNDGQVIKFLAMETDFYVFIAVETLDSYEIFGNWIAQAIQAVNALPIDQIPGVRPGYVAFRFEKNASDSIGVNVPIQQYNETARGKTGAELFRMFYTAP